MAKNNFDFPAGLSWGLRGLRVGKSAFGNWWVSISLPLGFRYIHVFKKNNAKHTTVNYHQQQLRQNTIQNLDLPTPSFPTIDKQKSKIKSRSEF